MWSQSMCCMLAEAMQKSQGGRQQMLQTCNATCKDMRRAQLCLPAPRDGHRQQATRLATHMPPSKREATAVLA